MALAITLAHHRYRRHLDSKISADPVPDYLGAICEHAIKMQRLLECSVAIALTGCRGESNIIARTALEVFVSQFALQFGLEKSNEQGDNDTASLNQSIQLRAEEYFQHGALKKLKLYRHPDARALLRCSEEDYEKQVSELEAAAKGMDPKRADKNWFQKPLDVGFKACLNSEYLKLFDKNIDSFSEYSWIITFYQNSDVHGDAFSSNHMYKAHESLGRVIEDMRGFNEPLAWHFVSLLTIDSLKMLSYLFDDLPKIEPMIYSALGEITATGDFLVEFLPITKIGYSIQ